MDKLRGIHVEKPDVCDSTVDSTVHMDSTQSVHVESTWKLRYSLMGRQQGAREERGGAICRSSIVLSRTKETEHLLDLLILKLAQFFNQGR